jgi:hypothetical protein
MWFARVLGVAPIWLAVPAALWSQAARPGAAGARDTMPEHVIARGDDLFNRQDGQGLAALYAPDAYGSSFASDSTGVPRAWGPDSVLAMVQRYWAGQKGRPRIRVTKRLASGPFVAVAYEYTDDSGTKPFFEVYEVRNGKIVHEWSQK